MDLDYNLNLWRSQNSNSVIAHVLEKSNIPVSIDTLPAGLDMDDLPGYTNDLKAIGPQSLSAMVARNHQSPSHPISILDGHRPTTAPDRERDYHPGVEFQGIGSHGAPLVDPSYDFHPDTEFQGLGSSGAPLTDPTRDYHPGVEFDGLDASGGPWAGLDTEAAVQSLGLSPMQAAETLAQQPVSRLSENDLAFGHILDIRENKAHPQNAKAQTLIGDWVSLSIESHKGRRLTFLQFIN
ncbi:hypothetical protein [Magnetospira sp. QH-2]|uniref:hypothetical protein n=1 Tax=Magnetospira sp. (strain QH-2) TaxID=1288970 RepID=UPI0011DCA338|nr:hypothetical protein [Magnetospira sp. QH-2]